MCGVQTWPSVWGVQLCTDLPTQNGSIDFSLDVRVVSWASRKLISRIIPQWTAVPFPNCARHPSLGAHCDSPRHTLSSGAKSSETSWERPSATGPTNGLGTEQKAPASWRSRLLHEHLIDRPTPRPNTECTKPADVQVLLPKFMADGLSACG